MRFILAYPVVVRVCSLYYVHVISGRAMQIRYLMLDNGIEFEDVVLMATAKSWGVLRPKTVSKQDKDLKTVLIASYD